MVYIDNDGKIHDDGLRIDSKKEFKKKPKRKGWRWRWRWILGVGVYFYFVIRFYIWIFTWVYEVIRSCLG